MTLLHPRPCSPADAAAVAGLINAAARAGGGRGEYAAAELEDVLRHEIRDLGTDTRALVDADGRMAAVALVPQPPQGGDRIELIGAVHPDRRGAGIGRELLAWQLARAADLSGGRCEAQVIAAVGDAPAIRLYERFGFIAVRYFLDMTAPTVAVPAAPLPDGLRLVAFERERARDVYRAHSAAFQGLWGYQERTFEAWAALSVESQSFRAGLARLALAGDTVAGYVLPYDRGSLYIGQVGTDTAWRRRGIATALLSEVLTAAGRAGFTAATLDTDAAGPTGAPSVYARAGFVVEQHIAVYRRTAGPAEADVR
jgi:ribosomal protein S18 acetylase RimI-like enzyme